MIRVLRGKMDVTHLNFERCFLSMVGHEHRSLYPFSSLRSCGPQDSFPSRPTLRCGELGSSFGCRHHFICMAFAQLTWREGLRDITTCLNARPEALCHLGLREKVAKSTLADANEQRDWRLWKDLARGLMRKARS